MCVQRELEHDLHVEMLQLPLHVGDDIVLILIAIPIAMPAESTANNEFFFSLAEGIRINCVSRRWSWKPMTAVCTARVNGEQKITAGFGDFGGNMSFLTWSVSCSHWCLPAFERGASVSAGMRQSRQPFCASFHRDSP